MVRVAEGTQIWVEDVLVHREQIQRIPVELLLRVAHRLHGEVPSEIIGQLRSQTALEADEHGEYPLDLSCDPPHKNVE